jgi:hypothetical protein
MKKLSPLAISLSAALAGIAVPVSFHWSPATGPLLSLDTAQAVIGRPLTAGSVAGVARRAQRLAYRRGYYRVGAGAAGGAYSGGYSGYAQGPSMASDYGGSSPGRAPGSVTVVSPATGRWCTMEPSGFPVVLDSIGTRLLGLFV